MYVMLFTLQFRAAKFHTHLSPDLAGNIDNTWIVFNLRVRGWWVTENQSEPNDSAPV